MIPCVVGQRPWCWESWVQMREPPYQHSSQYSRVGSLTKTLFGPWEKLAPQRGKQSLSFRNFRMRTRGIEGIVDKALRENWYIQYTARSRPQHPGAPLDRPPGIPRGSAAGFVKS